MEGPWSRGRHRGAAGLRHATAVSALRRQTSRPRTQQRRNMHARNESQAEWQLGEEAAIGLSADVGRGRLTEWRLLQAAAQVANSQEDRPQHVRHWPLARQRSALPECLWALFALPSHGRLIVAHSMLEYVELSADEFSSARRGHKMTCRFRRADSVEEDSREAGRKQV